jgi:hypothetical protein
MTAPQFAGQVFVVISRDVLNPDGLRADFKILETYEAAVSRQLELGKLNGRPSWIVNIPDPRLIAND